MNIVIATGIYPPEIGGPSEYARRLFETLLIQDHHVLVSTYGRLKRFPTGIRHIAYFVQLCIDAWEADYIIVLDTFSAALPAVLCAQLFGKKIVTRIGGDFLWESYAQRTHESVLLSRFYQVPRKFTLKEKIVFRLTRWTLRRSNAIVFSTDWQRQIWMKPYEVDAHRTYIIENYYPEYKEAEKDLSDSRVFLSPSRDIFIKNKHRVKEAFQRVWNRHPDISLDTKIVSHEVLMEKIPRAHAVIVASLSEVSPNLALDSIQYGVPVILTRDTGLAEKLEPNALFVDPLSVDSIEDAIESTLDPEKYKEYSNQAGQSAPHSWNEIAQEFTDILDSL